MTDRVESAPPRMWDRDRNALSSIDKSFEARPGRFWVTDPGTGESLGQVELSAASATTAPQSAVDATFFALVADMAGAPRELVDTDTGDIAGRVSQSLYGRRTWRGGAASPLLFAGQYEDAESGWVYNRFRFYDPAAGVYGAQDPLGVSPKIATAQGYVDHTAIWADLLALKAHYVTRDDLVKAGVDSKDIDKVQSWLNHQTWNSSRKELVNVGDGATDTFVYRYFNEDTAKYVGITNDLDRRAMEHGARFDSVMTPLDLPQNNLSEGADALSRHQARAIEQHYINKHQIADRTSGGTLMNSVNSIAPSRDIAPGVEKWASYFLRKR